MKSTHRKTHPIIGRPQVVFDPANKNHRKQYAMFFRNRTWGHSPYRFVIDDDSLDLVTCVERKLLEYYTNKDFK